MSTAKIAKDVIRQCSLLVGRRNLYRVSRFLMRAARADVANDPLSNGEKLVQTAALRTTVFPATILDVGANVGRWSGSLLEVSHNIQVPVHVHAFEPCRATFAQLSERARNWPEVTLNNSACSRRSGTAKMHVYGGGLGTNSLVEPIDGRQAVSEEVQLTTIDVYCAANEIGTIDLLKIDAEGYDFEVIVGASGMLDRRAVRILQFEYNQRWIGARNYLRDAFVFLNPKGYIIGKVTGSHVEFYPRWQWELENYAEGNYVACSYQEIPHLHPREPAWLSSPTGNRLWSQA
jgi:FkbM family methyltransferase